MDTVPSIRASLVLRGFGDDPSVVTRTLGLEPTRSGKPGDKLVGFSGQPTSRAVRQTYWALRSRAEPTQPLSRHVEDILEQLEGTEAAFARLPRGTTRKLFCTIIPEDGVPLLRIDGNALNRLGQMDVSLEIDVIGVGDPPADDG